MQSAQAQFRTHPAAGEVHRRPVSTGAETEQRRALKLRLVSTIAAIDERIDRQLHQLLHHPAFQILEASWRGLWYLAEKTRGTPNVKLKCLNASWQEVARDLGRAIEFDQSGLFHKIHNEEFGTAGGEPFGVILGDYEINHQRCPHQTDDMEVLERMAQIAAAAFCPFITGVAPAFFGLETFRQLRSTVDLDSIFRHPQYRRWHELRRQADSRFVGLAFPRTLMRHRYRAGASPNSGFHERVSHLHARDYCWSNAVYAFGGLLIREFANTGWFGHIRGVPQDQACGGLVNDLLPESFGHKDTGTTLKPLVEIVITEALERKLSECGFIPLSQCYDLPFAAFFSNSSIHAVDARTSDQGEKHKLAAQLQYVLCGSRVAHYVKVMIRDKIGSFVTTAQCEEHIRQWLFRYTTGRCDLDWETQARFPLREASVRVSELRGKPGHFQCLIRLVPHYQNDQMDAELELVTEFMQQGALT